MSSFTHVFDVKNSPKADDAQFKLVDALCENVVSKFSKVNFALCKESARKLTKYVKQQHGDTDENKETEG